MAPRFMKKNSFVRIAFVAFGLLAGFQHNQLVAQQLSPAMAASLKAQLEQEFGNSGMNATNQGGAANIISKPKVPQKPQSTPSSNEQNQEPLSLPSKQVTPFQKLVFETTGKWLDYYGDNAISAGNVAPTDNLPVSRDYEVSPGDEIMVRAWGGVNIDVADEVDRDGQFSIPTIGTFSVSGVKARHLEKHMEREIGKFYKNFKLSVTLGRLSGLKIFVSGQALNPGIHHISSTSTLASAVFTVAQPGENGTYRNILLKRGSQVVGQFDLYQLLSGGDLENDLKLQPGDVIQIPQAGNRVALNINTPAAAIFELKPNETLNDLLVIAGVDRTLIRQETVLIEGINKNPDNAPRRVEQLNYQRALNSTFNDGDILTLFPERADYANAVTLKGYVADPARYPHFPGMKVADLIPNREMLIPPAYFEQKNALAVSQTNDRIEASKERYAQLFGLRLNPNDSVADLIEELNAKDEFKNEEEKREVQAALSTLKNFQKNTKNSGGALSKNDKQSITIEDTVSNLLSEINWDYAVVERLDKKNLKSQLIPFNLRKALNNDPKENLALEPGDMVTIFSSEDADIPKSQQTALIKIEGEVKAPGYYQINPGETLRDVLVKAGGISSDAYLFGTKLTRRSIQEKQTEQLQKALDQAERMLQAAEASKTASALNAADASVARSSASSQRAYLDRLRQAQPDGRVVLDVSPQATSIAQLPPIPLENGDRISVPPLPGQITVFGSVYSQGAFAYQQNRSVHDYLDEAGGAVKSSDEGSIFVIRANGKVRSARQGWIPFVSGLSGESALPGDTIYVPEDYERVSFLKTMLDISTVFYQVGLGAAAVEALSD